MINLFGVNYANFCVDDIANCYTIIGEKIDESNYNTSNIAWIDLPHDKLGEDDWQWFNEDADFWNSSGQYWLGQECNRRANAILIENLDEYKKITHSEKLFFKNYE